MTDESRRSAREQRELVDSFVAALMGGLRALVVISARSVSEVRRSLSLPQFRVVLILNSEGPIQLNRLAETLGVDPSSAIRMIDRLLDAGFVTRQENPRDRRRVLLGVTPAGAALVRRVTAGRRRRITTIVNAMPVTPRAELTSALIAFSQAAERISAGTDDDLSPFGW